jgi:hypothetical protein
MPINFDLTMKMLEMKYLVGMTEADAEDARALLRVVVERWKEEIGRFPRQDEIDDLHQIQQDRLTRELTDKSPEARLAHLRMMVYQMRVYSLSNMAYELAKAVACGEKTHADAAEQAAALREDLDKFREAGKLLDPEDKLNLGIHFSEASLEANYALRGGAMSMRLGHEMKPKRK